MFKWLFVAFLCCTSLFADQSDNDPTIALARILTEKGTITASDLSRVQSADDHQRLSILTAILQDKGVLNNNDLAGLSPPALPSTQKLSPEGSLAGVTLEPVSAHVSTPQQPQSQAQTTEIAVTTKKRVAVSLYGTLLFTAGYNTANANFEDLPMILSKQGTDPTGGDKNFYETVRQSRFGLNLDPISSLGGKLSGTFEFDMMGGQAPYANGIGMNLFRMRLRTDGSTGKTSL